MTPRPRRCLSWKRLLLTTAVLLPLGGVVGLVAAATLEQKLLYPCVLRPAPEAMPYTRGTRRLWVEHEGGRTPGDFTPGVGRTAGNPGPLVVFFHGNGELIEDWAITEQRPGGLSACLDRGVSVLAVEYRGAGSATGEAEKDGIVADAVALRDLGAAQPEVDPDRIVLHGRSMGGGIAAAVALERPPAGMVLASAFTKLTELTGAMGIPSAVIRDRWDVSSTLEHFPGPVFISHGRDDTVIPLAMAEANAEAAKNSRLFKLEGGHNDAWPEAIYAEALRFVLP